MEIKETTRFRHWISDDTCMEGEAVVRCYIGSKQVDEFGQYDGDEYDADIEALYLAKEGGNAKQIDMRDIYADPKLYRALKDAAVDSLDYPPGLPVVFPGEAAPSETIAIIATQYKKAA